MIHNEGLILYKYYGYSAGLSALKSSRLGFREPRAFNDPFELSFLDNAEGPDVKMDDLEMKLQALKRSVAILSLTRTPLNPLMWAHYGQEHAGFVVGYAVETPFLTEDTYNLIPVDRGDVVYTSTKPLHRLTVKSRDLLHQVYEASQFSGELPNRSDIETLARKIFLTKHASWVYEEEVRVVKSFFPASEAADDPLTAWDPILVQTAPDGPEKEIEGLKVFRQEARIREVYLGVRNPLIYSRPVYGADCDTSLSEKAEREDWKVSRLRMATGSWDLDTEPLEKERLNLALLSGGTV